MTKSKTYNAVAGSNYIEGVELVFTTIYLVKRNGIQYDRYNTNINRAFIYNSAQGRIYFEILFEAGETVFVIYKETADIPGCVPVTITPLVTASAKVGTAYIRSYALAGTPPFTLNVITDPSWATTILFGLTFVRLSGTPVAEGTESLVFDVTNACGSDSINETFEVLPGTNNMTVTNPFLTRINSVTGIDYVITGGFFPMLGGIPLTAVHGAYTGVISVAISNIVFPKTLVLKKNGTTLETIPVPVNNTYNFSSQTFLSTDVIEIILS